MAVSRDIFSHHDLGVEFHCQLMGRDHGCRSVPNNTQDSPAQQRIIQSKTSIALRLRNPGTILLGGRGGWGRRYTGETTLGIPEEAYLGGGMDGPWRQVLPTWQCSRSGGVSLALKETNYLFAKIFFTPPEYHRKLVRVILLSDWPKKTWIWSQETWNSILAWPLSAMWCWANLDLLKPQFPYLSNGDNYICPPHKVLWVADGTVFEKGLCRRTIPLKNTGCCLCETCRQISEPVLGGWGSLSFFFFSLSIFKLKEWNGILCHPCALKFKRESKFDKKRFKMIYQGLPWRSIS